MRHGWTLKQHEWDCLLPVIRGTQWSKTWLHPLYQDSIPECLGVYAICATPRIRNLDQDLFNSLYNVIYIGKVDKGTLHRRFLQHCNQPKPDIVMAKRCFGNNLEYWYTEVDLDRINELEARLIGCFGPPANRISGIAARLGSPRPA